MAPLAAVGVDIGCGMIASRTSLTASDLPASLKPLRLAIEQAIPHGARHNLGRTSPRVAWASNPRLIRPDQ